jgi:hypothetical protein
MKQNLDLERVHRPWLSAYGHVPKGLFYQEYNSTVSLLHLSSLPSTYYVHCNSVAHVVTRLWHAKTTF